MNQQIKNIGSMAFFFGCIGYVVSGFFFDRPLSLASGAFIGLFYFLILYLILRANHKKQQKLLAEIDQEILRQGSHNLYGEDGVVNGLLFLTGRALCFYESEKQRRRHEFPLEEIAQMEYGTLFRHIKGCIITLRNGDTAKLNMTPGDFAGWANLIQNTQDSPQ